MRLGDLSLGNNWKSLLLKLVIVAILAGVGWRLWCDYRDTRVEINQLRQLQVENAQRYQALEVRMEESRKRTERRLEAVAIQAQEYARDSDMSVLVSDLNAELERWRRDPIRTGD